VAPGTVRWRSEGWADTLYGKYGMAVPDDRILESAAEKYILWGDSHAEALPVGGAGRAAAVYRALAGGMPSMVTYGKSGRNVADYYFLIPQYEKNFPGVVGHAILLSGLQDVLPDDHAEGSRFVHSPWRLVKAEYRPSAAKLALGGLVRKWSLGPLVKTVRRAAEVRLRFAPGECAYAQARPSPAEPEEDMEAGWRYLVGALRAQTDGELVFVYCPESPYLDGGEVVMRGREARLAELFGSVCRDMGVGFIDMTDRFNALYLASGAFPRGFLNSPPGTGHLNAVGQALVGQALHAHFEALERH
jgi:hypothetical protein